VLGTKHLPTSKTEALAIAPEGRDMGYPSSAWPTREVKEEYDKRIRACRSKCTV
jgi:hypothetical protein